MDFVVEKAKDTIPYALSQILDTCVNGITLADPGLPDTPLVYVNEAFELITGYTAEEVIGKNCRFLQGSDRDQEGLERIREAIRERKPVTVTLRNYRKDGTLFYNEVTIRPLFDRDGNLLYFLGIQYDVTDWVEAEQEFDRLNHLLRKVAK